MDHFSLKTDSLYKAVESEKLHRNFMGYSHSYTKLMIGLGVSSISDTWTAYGQNEKKVETYYEKINNGILPIVKGHFLTNEDLIIRQHILNLMCKFKTNWDSKELMSSSIDRAISLLAEMEKDKLIEMGEKNVLIKNTSRAYIRNVCMAFDARLLDSKPQSQLFSSTV